MKIMNCHLKFYFVFALSMCNVCYTLGADVPLLLPRKHSKTVEE